VLAVNPESLDQGALLSANLPRAAIFLPQTLRLARVLTVPFICINLSQVLTASLLVLLLNQVSKVKSELKLATRQVFMISLTLTNLKLLTPVELKVGSSLATPVSTPKVPSAALPLGS